MGKSYNKRTVILTEQQAKMLAAAEKLTNRRALNEENSGIKKKVKKIIAEYCASWIKPYLETPLPALDGHPFGTDEYFIKAHLNGNAECRETAMYKKVKESPTENRVIDLFKRNLYDQLSVRRGRGPEQYLPGAARILCKDLGFYSFSISEMKGGAVIRFCKTLRLIAAFPDFFLDGEMLDSDLNGMSFEEFDRRFTPRMREYRQMEETESARLPVREDNGYVIVRVLDEIEDSGMATLAPQSVEFFNQLNHYANDWCICDPNIGGTEYSQYVGGGGEMYIMMKHGFENIHKPAPVPDGQDAMDGRPLDEYGLSLICVIVGPDGLPDQVTTRWNHECDGENPDGLFTARDIQRVTGVHYFQTFKPRSNDELSKMHMLEMNEGKKKRKNN